MNRSRIMLSFVLALALAGLASLLVFRALKQSAVRASGGGQRVVMAARDIQVGAKLSEADLKMADWSAGTPPQGTVVNVADAVGRAVLYPVFRDEVVLEGKLAPVGSGAGLPAVIPEGMRAVSIRVDDVVAVAGFVGPGTRVDVLLTGDPNRGRMSSSDDVLTKTILENVQVLAAGEKVQPDAQGKPEKVNVVTLLCTPEDAAKVTLAANEGRIQLVLRNPGDSKKVEKEAVVVRQALYKGGASAVAKPAVPVMARRAAPRPQAPPPPVAVAPPPPPQPTTTTIEVIRGDAVTKVQVSATAAM